MNSVPVRTEQYKAAWKVGYEDGYYARESKRKAMDTQPSPTIRGYMDGYGTGTRSRELLTHTGKEG